MINWQKKMDANQTSYRSVLRTLAFLLSTFQINFFIFPPLLIAIIKHDCLIYFDLFVCSDKAARTQRAINLCLPLKCLTIIVRSCFYLLEVRRREVKADLSIFSAIALLNSLIRSQLTFNSLKVCRTVIMFMFLISLSP